MQTKFIHAADIHLGYRQYGLHERYLDFARAFRHIVGLAIERDVDFFLLAGDLFNKKTLGPQTLRQAEQALGTLRHAGIPVFAVEGNHDQASRRYRNKWSWPRYLEQIGLLRLLSMRPDGFVGAGEPPVPGLRIVGVPYAGLRIAQYVPTMVQHLEDTAGETAYTILLMHAGLEGVLPRDGFDTLRHDDIAPLKEHVDYLALGHVHKAYHRDGWIFNPGSPEACNVVEGGWKRGVYYVEVDTDKDPVHRWELLQNERRPFYSLEVDATNCHKPVELYQSVKGAALSEVPDNEQPVVQVRLTGQLEFDRADFHPQAVESAIESMCNPLIVYVKDQMSHREALTELDASKSREELERDIFISIAQIDSRYQEHAEDWADVMAHVKDMALKGEAGADIAGYIRQRITEIEGSNSS